MAPRLTPQQRFERDVTARGLAIPDDLSDALTAAFDLPIISEPRLYARLMTGCRVLDARGGSNAPDDLWDRWQVLLLAWQCIAEGNERRVAEGRRRRQRATTEAWASTPPATINGIRRSNDNTRKVHGNG